MNDLKNEYMKKWRNENRTEYRLYMRNYYKKARKRIDELKLEKPCTDCKKIYPPCVMDFDHKDPKIKYKDVSTMFMNSKEKLLLEVSKCELVCANCHRIRTYNKLQKNLIDQPR